MWDAEPNDEDNAAHDIGEDSEEDSEGELLKVSDTTGEVQ